VWGSHAKASTPGSSATTKAGCLRSRIAHTDRAAARTRLSTIAERLEKCVTELWYGRHHGKQCRRESSFLRLHSRCRRDGISRATGHFSSLITRPPSMLREEEQPADGAASPSLSPYPSGCRTVCRARREEVLRIGRAAHCPNHVRTGACLGGHEKSAHRRPRNPEGSRCVAQAGTLEGRGPIGSCDAMCFAMCSASLPTPGSTSDTAA
jgi:hypothetical protein